MEMRQVKIIKTLLETGSYTKTAELLNYTQSNVTQQVQLLEKTLNQKLFDYNHKQLLPTPFLKDILPMINQIYDASQRIKQVSEHNNLMRTIRIAAPESLMLTGLSEVIKNIINHYPHIDINLQNNSCSMNHQKLLEDEVDIAFVLNDGVHHDKLNATMICEEDIVVVAHVEAPDHFDELLKQKQYNHFVINEKGSVYRNMFEQIVRDYQLDIHKTTELWSIGVIKSLLLDNIGFSFLPYRTVKQEVESQQLKVIETAISIKTLGSYILTKPYPWNKELNQLIIDEVNKAQE
ncbi:LysR family transcriptional regulator [Staphylococcus haemolyticus]|uniref:LysR family transcriptional regulator n=1 Tax=Staphylococcus TaxID=1279 RepID=UPI00069D843C|nr:MULTISPECIES: LysR family transcriptional regulator [Staphylococcus]KAA2277874.1 LysR family transcriptional regulator [Staphylococcus sp. GDX7P312P]KAA2279675.1 LysR family transcriptional regulator [Staphylococcus sp. GDX7P459A]MCE4955145.1 LysR family transcriptional regulator [Staphylococcus haemolyticus]PTK86055.1 LysR family transcriptional regulator [Staphylococcus haemolyticus]PTL02388.1 LysR family transcriptional regulator [Staphylococcus haemolyticus]